MSMTHELMDELRSELEALVSSIAKQSGESRWYVARLAESELQDILAKAIKERPTTKVRA